MGTQFDWQIGADDEPLPRTHRFASWLRLGVMLLVVGLFLGGWQSGRSQLRRLNELLGQQAQAVLDRERQAFLAGDGDLFWMAQAQDPAWWAAQLRPENRAIIANGLTITRIEEHGSQLWANVAWTDEEGRWQRIAFFVWQDGQLVRAPAGSDYWGQSLQLTTTWGQLRYRQADQSFAAAVADFVSQTIVEIEPPGNVVAPFTLTLATDYSQTAAPDQVRLPSPRLLALDEAGLPGPHFWRELRQHLEAQLTPAGIRFAVPAGLVATYQQMAADFMVANPMIQVNIVGLSQDWADDPAGLFTEVDGAAIVPSERMLAAGYIHDLTDLAASDPAFDQADFYDPIWQGGWWQERLWLLPQSAALHLLFYDRQAYEKMSRPEPSLHWTWPEMMADVQTMASSPAGFVEWAFIDETRDTLFAFAYSHEPACQRAIADCRLSLLSVSAGYEWYEEMLRPGQMPDLSEMDNNERTLFVLNLVSPRKVAIWVANPVDYELFLLRQPMGVVPFPASAEFNGLTPLWVQGNVMSQFTLRPGATWQWLNFLTHQSFARQLRTIPARPSVAVETRFWETLPRPLNEAMRAAFPFARPVHLNEQAFFAWEQLARIKDGQLTPLQAAQSRPAFSWFDQ